MRTASIRTRYRARTKRSLCRGKSKSKCGKVRGCEYTKKTCRKKHNKKLKIHLL